MCSSDLPPVSAVPITHRLVERLMKAYPKQIAGMKDSSDDWAHTKSMIDAFAKDGFDVFSGNEKPLIDNIKSGGAGCISATANINPGKIAETYKKYATAEGEKLQGWINEVRGVMQGYVMIPALKYCIAHYGSDAAWTPVRPPLVETTAEAGKDMIAKLDKLGFTMPGLKQAMAVAAE